MNLVNENDAKIILAIDLKDNFSEKDIDAIWDIYINVFTSPPSSFFKKCGSCINEMFRQIKEAIQLDQKKNNEIK